MYIALFNKDITCQNSPLKQLLGSGDRWRSNICFPRNRVETHELQLGVVKIVNKKPKEKGISNQLALKENEY